MDPRQPQHPFSRNNASPYGRASFPPSSNTAPFPPASHPQQAPPQFPEHQRRPSDGQYYPPPRTYAQDGPPMSAPSHSRHPSSSSIGHGTPVPAHRQMPPPSSPQQTPHSYPPPISRGPPPSLGTPMSYSHGQNLPPISSHIPSLHRPPSTTGSSMSISALIGGPAPSSREPASHSQYPPPQASSSSTPSSAYPGPMQQSPRTHGVDYPAYRKPQTPDLPRPHELSGPRDHRANSAGSPPRSSLQPSPTDTHRYGTPQSYPSHRNMPSQQAATPIEDRREHYLTRVPNPSAPPRPNSQPMAMSGPSPQMSNVGRPEMSGYGRSNGLSEREAYIQAVDRDRAERENMLRERERDQRERELQLDRERMAQMQASQGQPYPHQQQHPQQTQFSRQPAEREQQSWVRPGYEQITPEQRPQPQVPVSSASYDYPRTTQAQYGSAPMYASDHRYPPTSQNSQAPPLQGPPNTRYEGPTQDEHRQQVQLQQQQQQQQQEQQQRQQQQQQQPIYNAPSGAFPPQHDSPQRRPEDVQMQQQRGFLGPPQEINRKGRLSPLPQAVQGAQGQLSVPGGEPGIKSEFGRMFSGIGSGAGSTMPTPSPGNSQIPFSNPQLRREDLEAVTSQEQPKEGGRRWPSPGSGSRGGRRRKPKEEDKGDDESTGRQTPTVRGAKRTKVAHHNSSSHPAHSNHHHHEITEDQATSQTLASFKTAKELSGATSTPQTSQHHNHHAPRPHSHAASPIHAPEPTIVLPKRTITSAPVLTAVSHLPRTHLGNTLYTSTLTPGGPPSPGHTHSGRGYTSKSNSIPRFEAKENCTFTIKVPRLYLEDEVRMEITSRKQIWGTDVYTDDSDPIAACIHAGWFRGAWGEDVDTTLLGLEIEPPVEERKSRKGKERDALKGTRRAAGVTGKIEGGNVGDVFNLTAPPPRGPLDPPRNRDAEIKILILPALEKYAGCTRFGIMSRGWKEGHDGGSFMVIGVRFVDGIEPVGESGTWGGILVGKESRGARRRERLRGYYEGGGEDVKVGWRLKKRPVHDTDVEIKEDAVVKDKAGHRNGKGESESSVGTLIDAVDAVTKDAPVSESVSVPADKKNQVDTDRDGGVDMRDLKSSHDLKEAKNDSPLSEVVRIEKENLKENSATPPLDGKPVIQIVIGDKADEPKSNGERDPEVKVIESNVRNES